MTAHTSVPVASAQHPVLVINPRSGGGKAERLGLVEQCRARGIEPVVLEQGADLVGLVEKAVAEGADVVGMAGGDGSQGAVASVVSRYGIAMVVVPSGTRNHLAMDLGLDRRDVMGALDAFGDAVEGRMDLAEVNGRTFVNNASLGLYAEIVRSPAYRDAKVETALGTLSRLLGPGTRPFPLRFPGPAGERYTAAHVVQVSNNPYGSPPGSIVSRPRLNGGLLGVLALELADPVAVRAFRAAAEAGSAERLPGVRTWAVPEFEVDADGPLDLGIDGEAVRMSPPLRFTIRPGALRVRVPRQASGFSPAARQLQAGATLGRLRPSSVRQLPLERGRNRSSGRKTRTGEDQPRRAALAGEPLHRAAEQSKPQSRDAHGQCERETRIHPPHPREHQDCRRQCGGHRDRQDVANPVPHPRPPDGGAMEDPASDPVAHQVGHRGRQPHPEHGQHTGGTPEFLGAERDQRRHHEHVAVHVGRDPVRGVLRGRHLGPGE